MPQRLEVHTLIEDGRATTLARKFQKKSVKIRVADVYTLENDLPRHDLDALAKSFVNPVSQKAVIRDDKAPANDRGARWAVEIGFLPGVTDNIGHTAAELNELTNGDHQPVYSSQVL